MKRTRDRLLSLALCAAICLSLLPGAALGAEGETYTDGIFTFQVLTEPVESTPGTARLTMVEMSGKLGEIEITVPETLQYEGKAYTVTEVGGGTRNLVEKLLYNGFPKSFHLPDTVTAINPYAFENLFNMTTVTGAGNLRSIGDSAFHSCWKLASLTLPDGLETIGEKAFYDCNALELDSLPDSLTSIGANAFSQCGLISITELPANLTSLGASAFQSCKGITALTIENTELKDIPGDAFSDSGLGWLKIGEGIETIGFAAFFNCYIEELYLPASLQSVGGNAFMTDGGVQDREVYFQGDTPPSMDKSSFQNGRVSKPQVFYVPKGAAGNYESQAGSKTTVHDGFPETVTLADIPGVTPPAAGQFPVERIEETEQYAGAVAWSPELSASGAFRPSTAYTATVTLTPKIGWKLDQIAANFFHVAGADPVTNAAGGGVVTAVFPATGGAAATIDALDIPGLTPPARGKTPVRTVEDNQYTGTVDWAPAVAENGVFAADQVYTATITLTPKPGYTLDGVTADTFQVAGAESVTHAASSGAVTAVFPATLPVPTGTTLEVSGIAQGTWAEIEAGIRTALDQQNLFQEEVTVLALSGGTASLEGWPAVLALYDIGSAWTRLSGLDLSGLTSLTSMAAGTPGQAHARLTEAVLPAGLDAYPADAFNGCNGLTLARLDRREAPMFAPSAFYGCPKLTLSVPKGATGDWDAAKVPWADGAALSALDVAGQTLIPAFSPRREDYRIAAEGETFTLTPTLLRPEDALAVNGQSAESGKPVTAELKDGAVTVTVTAKADPTDTRTYTVTPVDALVLDVAYEGGSLADALTDALALQQLSPDQVTTLRLTGGAAELTGEAWLTLQSLFTNGWGALSQVDLGGMTALKRIGGTRYAVPDMGRWTRVVLPEGLEEIGANAFTGATALTVGAGGAAPRSGAGALPDTVAVIGESAFERCHALTLDRLPSALREVGECAFELCTVLSITALPQGVERVGRSAFSGTGIGAGGLELPASLTEIGPGAFVGTSSLTGFRVAAGNPAYASRDGVLFDAGLTTLLTYPCGSTESAYTVPDGVTALAVAAFASSFNLEEVALPRGLTSIGQGAFQGCIALRRITIPAGVTTLADTTDFDLEDLEGTFASCTALAEVRFLGPVCPALGEKLFEGCPPTMVLIYPEGGTGYEALVEQAVAGGMTGEPVVQVVLADLTLSAGTLSPAFQGGTEHYAVTVPYGTKDLTLTPTAPRPGDTITVDGVAVASGAASQPVALSAEGETVVTVIVAKEGDPANTRTYTLTVTQDAPQGGGGGGGGGGVSTYSITPKAGEGGTIDPAKRITVRQGKSQTFTITPAEGYAVADVLVDGKSVGAVETYTFEQVKARHTIEARFAPAPEPEWDNPFADVAEDDWFYDHVAWAQSTGVMQGTAADTFAPEAPVTRAALVTTLHRLAGAPQGGGEGEPFTDVPGGAWYSGAVAWAVDAGITQGVGGGRFDPDGAVTREQLFTLLYRFALYQKRDVSAGENTNILSYTDALDLAEWSIPAFQWACGAGITEGTEDGALAPQAVATRAQLAAVLERYAGDAPSGPAGPPPPSSIGEAET